MLQGETDTGGEGEWEEWERGRNGGMRGREEWRRNEEREGGREKREG